MFNISEGEILNNISQQKNSYEKEPTPYDILTTSIGLMAVILNGLLLIAMFRNTEKIFISNGAYLVANVAMADALTGINSSLWGIKTLFLSKPARIVSMSIFWITIEASFLTIFIMCLERYIAIVYPFKANLWLSKRLTLYGCLLTWIISAVCGISIAFNKNTTQIVLAFFFEITIIVTCFLYLKIYFKLRERRLDCTPGALCDNHSNHDLQREYNLTLVVTVLTIILVVTVLPYMVGGQFSIYYKNNRTLALFLRYYFPVELTNFVLNPFIYAIRLPKYRRAILNTLKPITKPVQLIFTTVHNPRY
ncbi:melanocortin receptor 3-like [Xenia sp. Carnegie-2017]|uniref:melanocortin receptor 3-like n=1 Tax=Xenia sp. Carnegie-2017 TaxID=2897299 RepID=UPI001F03E958|nr:melanocortin receptor 3-like [Xenia sp. Carnegie-2017]